jgi:hypothetical protein
MTRSGQCATAQDRIRALLTDGAAVTFQAGGPSMTPTIRDGDLVEIAPVKPADIQVGHILLFEQHGRLLLHRCVRICRQNSAFIVVADAALTGTDTIPADCVLGVALQQMRTTKRTHLATPVARIKGRCRYALRPLRRWLHALRTGPANPPPRASD